MSRRSSRRPKKVPNRFDDMIHGLNSKNKSSVDKDTNEIVQSNEADVITDTGIGGNYFEEEVIDGDECNSNGFKNLIDNNEKCSISQPIIVNSVNIKNNVVDIENNVDFVNKASNVREANYDGSNDFQQQRYKQLGYVRVLVEIKAAKGFLDIIESIYVDGQCKNKRSRWVKVDMHGNQVFVAIARFKSSNAPMEKEKQAVKDRQKVNGTVNEELLRSEKVWNVERANVNEISKSVPTYSETMDWSYDMINYFKYAWEAMERRNNKDSEEKDVYENTESLLQNVIADEVIRKGCELGNNCQ
uniref:Uncharacterized protein n=1 Tax=Tanacetum cinerariifolium TaxID=118510 RepID=A0A699KPG1_TANCI|nr:hypothetical protein [Tanacetum cinerariifolium]